MISHNEEFVGALCPEQWHVFDGRLTHKGHLGVDNSRFEDSGSNIDSGASSPRHLPHSSSNLGLKGLGDSSSNLALSQTNSAFSSMPASEASSAVQSEVEGQDDMKFRARKKKKLTRAQLKEREVRRRLRYIEWLNSPKGTPQPPNTDDEAE